MSIAKPNQAFAVVPAINPLAPIGSVFVAVAEKRLIKRFTKCKKITRVSREGHRLVVGTSLLSDSILTEIMVKIGEI